jgi:hypothetical protein
VNCLRRHRHKNVGYRGISGWIGHSLDASAMATLTLGEDIKRVG